MTIELDVVTRLNRATAREAAREAQSYFRDAGKDAGDDFGDGLAKGIANKTPEVEKALKKVSDASGKVIVEQEKLNALKDKSGVTNDKLIAQSEKLRKAHAEEGNAIRDVNNLLQAAEGAMGAVAGAADGAGQSVGELGQQFGNLSKLAGPAIMVGAISAIGQLAGIAAQATGALGLLPAAIGGAALAFGSLKIATLGFSDALSAMTDPEEFSKALAKLSPNAQQATLAIKGLIPAFTELQHTAADALFAGVGGELNALANTYLPQIQATVTGISSAFNSMFAGLSQQLMTPETQQSIQQFMANITQSFQSLSGAIAPLTSAFADIMNVGSSFLPQLASGATNAAKAFGDMVHEAMQSGQLRQWMQEGLDVIQQLWPVVKNLGTTFMELGQSTKASLPDIVRALNGMIDLLPSIIGLCNEMTQGFTRFLGLIGYIDEATNKAGGTSERVWTSVKNHLFAILDPLNKIYDIYQMITDPSGFADRMGAGGSAQSDAEAKLNAARAEKGLPPITSGTGGLPGVPAGGFSWSDPSSTGWGTGGQKRWGGQPAIDWKSKQWNPGGKKQGVGSGGAATTPFVDPSQFMGGDPLAGMPAAVQGADPQKIFDADSTLITASHNLEQKKLALQVLEAEGNATQQQLLTAKNDLVEQERSVYTAQQKDIEARTNMMKQSAADLNSIFAPLDKDFGISKGIPGIVENITKMFGNMALGGAIASSPVLQAGVRQIAAEGQSAQAGGYGGAAGGYGGALGGYGGYGGDAALLSSFPTNGRYDASGDLSKGLGDCSSAVEDLVNIMDGRPTAGRSMATGNEAEWLTSRGFMPGMGGPGDFRVGFNNHHTQATLPQGTNFNYGSNASAAVGGLDGSQGAYDPAFTDHYYRPAGGASPSAMGPVPIGGGMPGVPGGAPIGGAGSLPQIPAGAGGQGYMGLANVGGAQQGPSTANTGSQPEGGGSGSGGISVGGDLIGAAGMAADLVAPGSSIGIKLANRAIQFGSQAAGIGVSGAMETLLPAGSPLASNSWFSKLAGGVAGAKPAKPNQAGKGAATPPQQPGAQPGQQPGQPGPNGQPINITYNNNQATEDRAGADLTNHLSTMNQTPGPGNPRG